MAVYGGATLAKWFMADSEEEAWLTLSTAGIGYFGARFDIGGTLGYSLAALSGMLDASVPTPVGSHVGPPSKK